MSKPDCSNESVQRIERGVQPAPELAAKIFDHHTKVFEAVLEDHPLYQGLFDVDFDRLMKSPDCVTYLARMGGEILGHMIVSTNLDDVKWLSGPYFELTFPDDFRRKTLFFVASLGADDGCSPKLVRGLIDALVIDVATVGGMAIADFRMTKSNARLPILIAGRSNSLAEASFMRLPTEQFIAFRAENLRDDPLNLTEGIRTIVEAPGWVPPKSALGVKI